MYYIFWLPLKKWPQGKMCLFSKRINYSKLTVYVWSKGTHGAAGTQGPRGPNGSAGPGGRPGHKGKRGYEGLTGPEGLKGDRVILYFDTRVACTHMAA